MKEQNYIYRLTKQRTSQSMRMRGAQASFDVLRNFLNLHTYGIKYKNASITYFTWVDTEEKADEASALEQKLFDGLNSQIDHSKSDAPTITDFTRRILRWELSGSAENYLAYIDDLNVSQLLSPKPVVTLVFSVDFWLNETPRREDLKSSLIAWLSPTSNSVDFTLNFSPSLSGEGFDDYRVSLQKDCPVKLEDKYFYLRTLTDR